MKRSISACQEETNTKQQFEGRKVLDLLGRLLDNGGL